MVDAELDNERIRQLAWLFAKANRKRMAKTLVDTIASQEEVEPWTIFMAGSPGAGKTEVSKAFAQTINACLETGPDRLGKILRIDPDEFRDWLPGYTGNNSSLFNRAVSVIVESTIDRAFKKNVSFILDGTLASEGVAQKNISRALGHGRDVTIMYVYQDPIRAWRFVQNRELVEGRNIPLDDFVRQYFAARKTVKTLKQHYGDAIKLDLFIQSTHEDQLKPIIVEDVSATKIDAAIPEPYSDAQLLNMLAPRGKR